MPRTICSEGDANPDRDTRDVAVDMKPSSDGAPDAFDDGTIDDVIVYDDVTDGG